MTTEDKTQGRAEEIASRAKGLEITIQKDPGTIRTGYQAITSGFTLLVGRLESVRNLSEEDMESICRKLKTGLTEYIPIIEQALKNLSSRAYDPSKVAYALSICSETLEDIQRKYNLS